MSSIREETMHIDTTTSIADDIPPTPRTEEHETKHAEDILAASANDNQVAGTEATVDDLQAEAHGVETHATPTRSPDGPPASALLSTEDIEDGTVLVDD